MLDDYTDKVEVYLSHLWEIDRNHIDKLDEDDLATLASRLIKETPTKMIPRFEDYDRSRDLTFMIAGWMESQDSELGEAILEKMRDLTIEAMTPLIQDRMEDYAKRHEIAVRETRENERLEGISFDRNRI